MEYAEFMNISSKQLLLGCPWVRIAYIDCFKCTSVRVPPCFCIIYGNLFKMLPAVGPGVICLLFIIYQNHFKVFPAERKGQEVPIYLYNMKPPKVEHKEN